MRTPEEFLKAEQIEDCELQVGNVVLLSYPPQVPVKKLSQLLADFASQSKPEEITSLEDANKNLRERHSIALDTIEELKEEIAGHEKMRKRAAEVVVDLSNKLSKAKEELEQIKTDTKTVDAVDPTFWRRLEMFVSNIQVNDMAGEEEKQYIIHVIESKK